MPTPRAPRRKHRVPPRRYVIDTYLKGELAGAHIVMAGMNGRDLIRLQSGDLTEAEAMEFAASKVVEHDLEVADILDLELPDLLQISQAWRDALRDAAVPPESGAS